VAKHRRTWWRKGDTDWTLRRQLIALLVVFTVGPLLLTNVWGYLQSRRAFEQSALSHAHAVATLEATAIFRLVHEQYQLVAAVVAGNQDLFGLLRALATPDAQARRAVLGALRTHLVAKELEGHSVAELYVLSPAGQLIVSTLPAPARTVDQSASPCFRRGREVNAIDGVDWSSQTPALLISAPIHDTAGTFLGVFCARTHILLGNEPGESFREPAQTTVYLVDSQGRVIASENGDSSGTVPGSRLPHVDPRWVFGQQSWQGSYDEDGQELLLAYAPITELGWGILVETPTRAALASLDTLMWQAALFVLVLAALVVVAGVAVARHISRPVAALSAAARSAATGTLGVIVPPGGTVEVRDLARSFNQMSAAVKESHDLLEQRIAARTHELQASQEFSERLLNSIDQPVVVIDQSLIVVKANKAALRRYGPGVLGKSYHANFECAGRLPCRDCPVRAAFDSGRPGSVERVERIGDAKDIVSLSSFPVRAGAREVEAVIQIRRVVTSERNLQAQMVHQEKMSAFGIMAAGVAHEIGNPLAAIQSQLTLAREAPAPGRVEQTLAIVSHEVDRIARLLRELVSFARRRDDEPTLVSVDGVARDVVRLIRHDPRAHHVDIDVKIDGRPVPVRAKEDSLVQVLINLGLNALDAMPDGGKLTFEAGSTPGRVILRVRDTGRGVPEAARTHLFEPFFTTKAPGRGTGLGLFVSRGIVERMGGDITLEETGSEGTIFRVSLPLAAGWSDEAHA
jgi:C4-dicarboxylate-specific signal transduction histidine kinase